MSVSRYRTSPVIFTPGIRSFMRFSVFRKVDFPQPEGPIRAVMLFSGSWILIFFNAWALPYHRHRFFAVIALFIAPSFS